MNIPIHCKHDELISVKKLKPHPKNRNIHPKEQIERLAKMIAFQGIRAPIVVSKLSGFIVKGHGTLMALEENNIKEVPVVYQDFDNTDQEYAFVQGDNAIAAWAELDLSGINMDIPELGPMDIDLLGLKDFKVDFSENTNSGEPVEYTKKIEAPIYTPKGEKPETTELFDYKKTDDLINKINSKNLKEEVSHFLKLAAYRHIVFDYEKIAEFYSHANKDVQELMEDSALVIIDFNKAIEHGFVQMTKEIASVYPTKVDNE